MDRNRRLTLSVTEAAELLGISRALAYELVARGELPSLQLGRRLVVPWRAIERLLASCEDTEATASSMPAGSGTGSATSTTSSRPSTTTHSRQPNRNHTRATRATDRETASEEPTRLVNTHAPKPTHTLASGMRRRTNPRTERVPPQKSS